MVHTNELDDQIVETQSQNKAIMEAFTEAKRRREEMRAQLTRADATIESLEEELVNLKATRQELHEKEEEALADLACQEDHYSMWEPEESNGGLPGFGAPASAVHSPWQSGTDGTADLQLMV